MRYSLPTAALLSPLFLMGLINAHGWVSGIVVGDQKHLGSDPRQGGEQLRLQDFGGFRELVKEGTPQRPTGNTVEGPTNLPPSSLTGLLATGGSASGQTKVKQLTVPAKAGDLIVVYFLHWPVQHYGVSWNMMANCGGSCDGKKGEDLEWFKISEEKYDPVAQKWPTDLKDGGPGLVRLFTLPTNLPSGEYLLSTTLLAIHSVGAPQYYVTAWQIKLESDGKTNPSPRMKIPDMYTQLRNDAATYSVWSSPDHSAFSVPGVPVYTGSDSVAGDAAGDSRKYTADFPIPMLPSDSSPVQSSGAGTPSGTPAATTQTTYTATERKSPTNASSNMPPAKTGNAGTPSNTVARCDDAYESCRKATSDTVKKQECGNVRNICLEDIQKLGRRIARERRYGPVT